MPFRVKLTSFEDWTYKFTIRSPPVSWFVKKSLGKEKLSGHRVISSGDLSIKNLYEIAKV